MLESETADLSDAIDWQANDCETDCVGWASPSLLRAGVSIPVSRHGLAMLFKDTGVDSRVLRI
jgi:hypothetical protein